MKIRLLKRRPFKGSELYTDVNPVQIKDRYPVNPEVLSRVKPLISAALDLGEPYEFQVGVVEGIPPILSLNLRRGGSSGMMKATWEDVEVEVTQEPGVEVRRGGRLVFSTSLDFIFRRGIRRVGGSLVLPLRIDQGEGIYGLGEFFGPLNRVGGNFRIYVKDVPALPNYRTYVAYPFFWSTKGYGLLINTFRKVVLDFGSEFSGVGQISVPGEDLEAYLILSEDPYQILKAYWELTGFPEVPPLWSFGIWYSAWRDGGYKYSEYRTQEDVIGLAREVRRRGLPGDVIHVDPVYTRRPLRKSIEDFMRKAGLSQEEIERVREIHEREGMWSFRPVLEYLAQRLSKGLEGLLGSGNGCTFEFHDGFPSPQEMTKAIHDLGFRVSIWVNPYAFVNSRWFQELQSRGALVKGGVEMPATRLPGFPIPPELGGSLISYRYPITDFGAVDFTSEEGRRAYSEKIGWLLGLGFDVIKTDYGEGAPEEGEYAEGSGDFVHNLYPNLYNQVVYETIKDAKGEALVWGRSGSIGIHRYPLRWTGDPDSTWRGMAASLRGALSLSASGVPFSSFDSGGYGGKPSEELYIRWAQMGLLFSHCRFHGTTEREPWKYGERAMEVVKKYAELRYSLIPYLYSQAVSGIKGGKPLVRPLVMEFPRERACREVEDQYMLGDSIMVIPWIGEGAREVYIPRGKWWDFWTKAEVEGGRYVELNPPLDLIPVFVKDGSAIPYTSKRYEATSEEMLRDLRVEVYGEVREFHADFGKYGSFTTKVDFSSPIEVNGFKLKFVRVA